MAKQAQSLMDLARVRADQRDFLNRVVGNQGTALGRKNFTESGDPDGDPCIIIYMPHKLNAALLSEGISIPEKLVSNDGSLEAPTDVVVTTIPNQAKDPQALSPENSDLVAMLQWIDGSLDHLPPGAQIGGAELTDKGVETYVGTIGYAVRSQSGLTGLLTNQHVGGSASRSLYVPGAQQQAVRVGVTREVREHYPDDEWLPGINEQFAYVRTDAAFVAVEPNLAHLLRNDVPILGEIRGVYEVDLDTMDVIGLPVRKVGRTTGLTDGLVVAFGYGVANANEQIDRNIGAEPANVYTDFLIAPAEGGGEFSAPGDSGSAILVASEEHQNEALGLLWGGWPSDIGRGTGPEDMTYGINLQRILTEMRLELL